MSEYQRAFFDFSSAVGDHVRGAEQDHGVDAHEEQQLERAVPVLREGVDVHEQVGHDGTHGVGRESVGATRRPRAQTRQKWIPIICWT